MQFSHLLIWQTVQFGRINSNQKISESESLSSSASLAWQQHVNKRFIVAEEGIRAATQLHGWMHCMWSTWYTSVCIFLYSPQLILFKFLFYCNDFKCDWPFICSQKPVGWPCWHHWYTKYCNFLRLVYLKTTLKQFVANELHLQTCPTTGNSCELPFHKETS